MVDLDLRSLLAKYLSETDISLAGPGLRLYEP